MTKVKSYIVRNVGELREILSQLPDDMPIHRRGDGGGNHPSGKAIEIFALASAKRDPDYFGAIEIDPVWKKTKKYKNQFNEPFKALCI